MVSEHHILLWLVWHKIEAFVGISVSAHKEIPMNEWQKYNFIAFD